MRMPILVRTIQQRTISITDKILTKVFRLTERLKK